MDILVLALEAEELMGFIASYRSCNPPGGGYDPHPTVLGICLITGFPVTRTTS